MKISDKTEAAEFHLSVDVDAKFDGKRKPGAEESDEEAAKLDEAFAAALKELQDKLATEQELAGRIFRVRSFVADPVNKKRSEILKSEDAPAAAPGAGPGGPGGVQLPGFPQGLPGLKP